MMDVTPLQYQSIWNTTVLPACTHDDTVDVTPLSHAGAETVPMTSDDPAFTAFIFTLQRYSFVLSIPVMPVELSVSRELLLRVLKVEKSPTVWFRSSEDDVLRLG